MQRFTTHARDGYCSITADGPSNCATDLHGSFRLTAVEASSWNSAAAACIKKCLACERCRHISVSLEYQDCSWHSEYDCSELFTEPANFRTLRRVQRKDISSQKPRFGETTPVLPSADAMSQLLPPLPPLETQRLCWAPHCAMGPVNDEGGDLLLPFHSRFVLGDVDRSYGHVWSLVDTFFQCVVQERIARPHATNVTRRVFLPSFYMNYKHESAFAFQELSTLFSGSASRLLLQPVDWVPVCHEKGGGEIADWQWDNATCCSLDASSLQWTAGPQRVPSPTAIAQLEVRTNPHLEAVWRRLGASPDPWTWRRAADGAPAQSRRDFMRAMRTVAWANLGLPPAADGGRLVSRDSADLVLFASAEGGTNGRRLRHEDHLADTLEHYLAAHAPALSFRHERLHTLAYADELRLLRRARIYISLFGSALHVRLRTYPHPRLAVACGRCSATHADRSVSHCRTQNCRFLPDGAIVIELHGALKNDVAASDFYLYHRLCQVELGLRWVGVPVPNAAGNLFGDDGAFDTATLNASAFVRSVEAALRGQWRMLARTYVSAEERLTRRLRARGAVAPISRSPQSELLGMDVERKIGAVVHEGSPVEESVLPLRT